MRLGEIIKLLEIAVPLELAEEWDRCGLQIGDPQMTVNRILVALDPTKRAVAQAKRKKAGLLITHHPLFLVPLKSIDTTNPQAALAAELIKNSTAHYSCHTNFDKLDGGVNDALAGALGLSEIRPLLSGEDAVKVVVTVPVTHAEAVIDAIAVAGGGVIGNYERCAFGVDGEGTFTARRGANPFVGKVGRAEKVAETRIEMTAVASSVKAVVAAARAAHPYEEPVIDIYRMAVKASQGGLGRIGRLSEELTLYEFARVVEQRLSAKALRFAGDKARKISKVAVIGGSGATLWRAAKAAGADVLVTGDAKHHDAVDALEAGFAIIDAGHAPTERVALAALAKVVRKALGDGGKAIKIETYAEDEPFGLAN